jgi:hypothetical protein
MVQWISRGMLGILLAAMPWAALSSAASLPSRWAGLVHLGANAGLAVLACTGFVSPRGRAGAVLRCVVSGAAAAVRGQML